MASRGLPCNPRPRTKSAVEQPMRRLLDHQAYPLPSNSRHGSGMTSGGGVSDTRLPSMSSHRNRSNQRADLADSRRTHASSPTSSLSSASSSVWARGNRSSASSRTTLPSDEDEYEPNHKSSLRSNNARKDERRSEENDGSVFTWNKVTEAATVFTQEVTKAYAHVTSTSLNPLGLTSSNASSYQEEDSHLTQVMRAYHLSKARTPSELPDWLFSARERGQLGGLLQPESHHDDPHKFASGGQRNHLGNGQITTLRNREAGMRDSPIAPATDVKAPPVAKVSGVDRLKSLRDARRMQRV